MSVNIQSLCRVWGHSHFKHHFYIKTRSWNSKQRILWINYSCKRRLEDEESCFGCNIFVWFVSFWAEFIFSSPVTGFQARNWTFWWQINFASSKLISVITSSMTIRSCHVMSCLIWFIYYTCSGPSTWLILLLHVYWTIHVYSHDWIIFRSSPLSYFTAI